MSWGSTELYYRRINHLVAKAKGGLHSAPLVVYSFDFAPIAELQKAEDWERATEQMVNAAKKLKLAGAEAIVICTNTMHRMAGDIAQQADLQVLHIIDAIAEEANKREITSAGILGTYFTMSAPFYRDYFEKNHQITLIAPDEQEKQDIHRIIYEELCRGEVRDTSRLRYIEIMRSLEARGAESIILGCTEIGLLLTQSDYPTLALLDSTELHAQYAASFVLENAEKM